MKANYITWKGCFIHANVYIYLLGLFVLHQLDSAEGPCPQRLDLDQIRQVDGWPLALRRTDDHLPDLPRNDFFFVLRQFLRQFFRHYFCWSFFCPKKGREEDGVDMEKGRESNELSRHQESHHSRQPKRPFKQCAPATTHHILSYKLHKYHEYSNSVNGTITWAPTTPITSLFCFAFCFCFACQTPPKPRAATYVRTRHHRNPRIHTHTP